MRNKKRNKHRLAMFETEQNKKKQQGIKSNIKLLRSDPLVMHFTKNSVCFIYLLKANVSFCSPSPSPSSSS